MIRRFKLLQLELSLKAKLCLFLWLLSTYYYIQLSLLPLTYLSDSSLVEIPTYLGINQNNPTFQKIPYLMNESTIHININENWLLMLFRWHANDFVIIFWILFLADFLLFGQLWTTAVVAPSITAANGGTNSRHFSVELHMANDFYTSD